MTTVPPAVAALTPRRIGARTFDFARRCAVMAVVNRTPDSFFDRGATFALERAVEHALRAVDDGADWVDVGGLPFSPDTPEVSVAEEIDRVLPVVEAIRSRSDVVISVDTYRPAVAEAVLDGGADVINDVMGLRVPGLVEVVADRGATVVVAHSRAEPHQHLRAPRYDDVVADVVAYLEDRVAAAVAAGVAEEAIVIDPGHDLNKNTYHSLELTRRLSEIARIGYPLLVAVSNKDFIGETLKREQEERVEGTIATLVVSILNGARIVRVHDVPEARQAVNMVESILGWRPPAYVRHNLV